MAFVQIIDHRTSKFDEMEQIGKEWEAASQSETTARRRIVLRDRDDPERYLTLVFFDSYDEAMKNSDNPVTQEFSGRMAAVVEGAPTFINLDIIDDVTY